MKDTYTYQIGDNLYLNLTNRCSNRCTFCVREGKETYEGYPLWLKGGEPDRETVLLELGDPKRYREIVFCGFGEPTCRLDDLLWLCDEIHKKGGKTRLNTNGHGSILAGRDIAPDLKGRLDGINVSLNAPDEAAYNARCRPLVGNAFCGMIDFAKKCRENGLRVWFSVVDCIGEEKIARCRQIADEVGIPLRVRETIE